MAFLFDRFMDQMVIYISGKYFLGNAKNKLIAVTSCDSPMRNILLNLVHFDRGKIYSRGEEILFVYATNSTSSFTVL